MKNPVLLTREEVIPRSHFALYWTFAHAWVLAKRRLTQIPRRPDELLIATLQPTMLVLLFRYVFGGAIRVAGTSYANYLMAGVFVLASLVGSLATGIGLATDLQQGLLDRFRSLPMARSAVLTGRTLADLVRNGFVVLVIWAVGLLVGFRPAGPPLAWVAATGVLLLTTFTFSWLAVLLGLVVSSPEAVQGASLVLFYPLLFGSNAFVPTSTMPDWLRAFADHQPISVVIGAVRGLLLNQPDAATIGQALTWCVVLLMIFIGLSIWAYGRRTAK
ncbi:MAG TPA: ABC transporter permease [Ktedonobacteraceae bacterium]|nr:ABC transporter permease [Ktedonobacteraceae bacterium]